MRALKFGNSGGSADRSAVSLSLTGGAQPSESLAAMPPLHARCVRPQEGLFPFALECECCPIVGGAPALISPGRDLSRSERSGRAEAPAQHCFIESAHQICGSPIVDLPQARYYPECSCIHEAASETYEALALYLLAQGCLARAQDDKVRLELEIIYVVKPQEPILWLSLLVDKRQDD